MHRHFTGTFLVLFAAAVIFTGAASAGEEDALREEVQQLREKIDTLAAQQSTLLEQEIEAYLDEKAAFKGAQGGASSLDNVSISARFTAVNQNTVGLDQFNRSVVSGDVDLDFDFKVTENLDLFIYLTANENEGHFEAQFAGIASSTLAGFDDGIGVNGTVSTQPGSITVRETGIKHALAIGDNQLHWELGELDPRNRFMQNAFAGDENTQFIHNMFDDSSAVLWLTSASSPLTSLGLHMWISFGANKQITLNWGWFNIPGQWFNNGQFYFQFHWKGEVGGREMNVRLMGFLDEFNEDSNGDGTSGGGASWDWWVTDKIGLFFLIGVNGDDVASVESDYSVGAQFNGLFGSRPDDVLGVAVGFANANTTVLPGLPEDLETTVEIYYKYMAEGGKLQITPNIIYVQDPGGGGAGWFDDTLFIIGFRIHVPF
jgi:hypothetical protein